MTELLSLMEGTLAKLMANGNPHAILLPPDFGPGLVGAVRKIFYHFKYLVKLGVVPDHSMDFFIEFYLTNVPGAREAGIVPGLTKTGRREMMMGVCKDLFASGGAKPGKPTPFREPVEINRSPACAVDLFAASEVIASSSKRSIKRAPKDALFSTCL